MPKRCARRAYSLLEVVLASAICASALVPALALMRDGLTLADTIDVRHQTLLCGVSKMEEALAIAAALGDAWPGTPPGPGGFTDFPGIRYTVTWSDSPASGGITGQLMSVTVITYRDDNGNGAMDAGEMRTTLSSKVGKLQSYVQEANN